MNCPNCGCNNEDESKQCSVCGMAFNNTDMNKNNANKFSNSKQAVDKKYIIILLIVVIITVIAVAAAVVVWAMNKDDVPLEDNDSSITFLSDTTSNSATDSSDYMESESTAEVQSTSTTNKTTKKSVEKWKDSAVELIYNFPKYGMKIYDTSINIELIDLNSDGVPEIIYGSNMGSNLIPDIDGVYYFNGSKYVKGKTKFADNYSNHIPILPKKDSSGKRHFMSKLNDTEDISDYLPSSSFWYYYRCGVSEFKFSNNTLTSVSAISFEKYRDAIDDYSLTEYERWNKFDDYISAVNKFNKKYQVDSKYKYTVAMNIQTGYIDENLSTDKQLKLYHETVSKSFAQKLVDGYNNSKHKIS